MIKFVIVLIFAVFPLITAAQTPVKQTNVTREFYRYAVFPSKITNARNIDVWLPPDYNENKDKKYPVIYMHDGQNLLSPQTSQSKIEWRVDETLTRLIEENKLNPAVKADALIRKRGYKKGKNWMTQKFVGDDHTKKSWGGRVEISLIFLLGK